MFKYKNGNSIVSIYDDGTRIITSADNEMKLDYPLNIDIRVSTKCPYGLNPKTGKAKCSFCHESAITNGRECDYDSLKNKLDELPNGLELAIGANFLSKKLERFLISIKDKFIINLTVNSYAVQNDTNIDILLKWMKLSYIKGLGLSYRRDTHIPNKLLKEKNVIVHVINGLDNYDEVKKLSYTGVKKILVLGEKDFGFNKNNVKLDSASHKNWFNNIQKFIKLFDVISFDNLALEQLKINRFLSEAEWNEFYQHEKSFYINAVDKYYSPSSRSELKMNWNDISIKDYFKYRETLE